MCGVLVILQFDEVHREPQFVIELEMAWISLYAVLEKGDSLIDELPFLLQCINSNSGVVREVPRADRPGVNEMRIERNYCVHHRQHHFHTPLMPVVVDLQPQEVGYCTAKAKNETAEMRAHGLFGPFYSAVRQVEFTLTRKRFELPPGGTFHFRQHDLPQVRGVKFGDLH